MLLYTASFFFFKCSILSNLLLNKSALWTTCQILMYCFLLHCIKDVIEKTVLDG